MKAESLGKKRGFSTLELMIAFALISIVLVGAVGGNFIAQYWTITSRTANEALYKAKTKLEDERSLIKGNFYGAVSTPLTKDTSDSSCTSGGLCYYVQSTINDISSCSKYVTAYVEWQVESYPKTSTTLSTNLTNTSEIINRGGDCLLNVPNGNWKTNPPQSVGSVSFSPGKQLTGIDVLHKKIYVTTNTVPSFLVYNVPTSVGTNPTLAGSLDLKLNGFSVKINSLDVEEDLSTGRTYAFLAVGTTTKQLMVLDATDPSSPTLVSQKDLQTVSSGGSYPQGFRIFVYDGRVYITVRETTGTELHIFDISTPTLPIEIGNGIELNRTVEDMVVREEKVSGVKKKFAYLSTDSDTKELTVLDVTNDIVNELTPVDLAGIFDGTSVDVIGNKLYFGRLSNSSGPELFVFDITIPGSPTLIGQTEVGNDVTTIKVFGDYAFVGTPNGIQVWSSDNSLWISGKLQNYAMPNMAPLGFDVNLNWIYSITSNSATDKIQVLYTP